MSSFLQPSFFSCCCCYHGFPGLQVGTSIRYGELSPSSVALPLVERLSLCLNPRWVSPLIRRPSRRHSVSSALPQWHLYCVTSFCCALLCFFHHCLLYYSGLVTVLVTFGSMGVFLTHPMCPVTPGVSTCTPSVPAVWHPVPPPVTISVYLTHPVCPV